MSHSVPPRQMSPTLLDGRPPRYSSAESRAGSPYLAAQNAANTTPSESSATYRRVPLTRSTSADHRRGRPESPEMPGRFSQAPRPRAPSEAGSEATMGARVRHGGGSLGLPGRQGSFPVPGKLGGSVGIPGAPGMPLQPITRVPSEGHSSPPTMPRQRSMTEQIPGNIGGNIGGSIGIPGGQLGRQDSFHRSQTERSSLPGTGSLGLPGMVGGSVGIPGKLGGSVGIPGGRARSQTDSHIFTSSGGARGRSESPAVQDLRPKMSQVSAGSSQRPRSVSVDNRGDVQEYVPRAPSDVQAMLDGNYVPLDRAAPSGAIRGSLQQAMDFTPQDSYPVVNERDTSWLKIGAMGAAWGYCLFAWVCGVTQHFSELDVMPNTPLHWKMTRSALHTLEDLWLKQAWFAFYALGFFSIVIPVGKISGTGYLVYALTSKKASDIHNQHRLKIHTFSYFASYQFVDLYCGMLFVCFFTSEASATRFGIGFYWFFSYCCASLMLSVFLDSILIDAEPPEVESDPAAPLMAHDPMSSRYSSSGMERSEMLARQERASNMAPYNDEEANMFSPKEPNVRHNRWSATPPWSKAPKPTYKGQTHKETFPELWTTRFFAFCFFVMMMLSPWGYFLEVRMIVHTVAVERTVMSLSTVLCDLLPGKVHGMVIFILWMLTVFLPFSYTALQLARVEHRRRYQDTDNIVIGSSITIEGETFKIWSKLAVDFLRQWCHVDVVGIASLVFLFMVQDSSTLTMVPDGTFTFYFFIAAAASFMFLRWFCESEVEEGRYQWAPKARLVVLIVLYVGFITVIWGGVPGAAPHFQYQTLDSVCKHAQPFLHKVRAQLPQSYGNCKDTDSHPPQPCVGDSNLQTSGSKKQYMNAIWIGGLRTLDVHECELKKVENPRPGMSQYQFHIAGEFEKLSLYLRVKQCMPMGGCVKMNSADHCCGKHIGFNFTFSIDCKSVPGSMNAIRNLQLVDASFGKMIVHQEMMGGTMHVEAMDISGQVEGTVKDHIKDMLDMRIPWGGQSLSIGRMLNKLVQYNAPTDAGRCL